MAGMIREESDLPTLRCGIGLKKYEPVMVTRAFLGAEPLDESLRTSLNELGYPDDPTRPDRFRLSVDGTGVETQLRDLGNAVSPDDPIWVQVEADSMLAALFPWEEAIARHTRRMALRIPNFLRSPVMPRKKARLGICASGPRAKGSVDVLEPVLELLDMLDVALENADTALTVRVFVDVDTRSRLGQRRLPAGQVTVELVPFEDFEAQSGSRDDAVRNIWLRWIADTCRGQRLDAMHFICPGLLSSESGSLALAEAPDFNQDRRSARFVQAQELTAFYDRLGCSIMGFSAIGASVWQNGIHALAYELGWNRPGPVFVGEPGREMAAIYRAMLTGESLSRDYNENVSCIVHPDLVGLAEGKVIESVAASHAMPARERTIAAVVSHYAQEPTRGKGGDLADLLGGSGASPSTGVRGLGGLIGGMRGGSSPSERGGLGGMLGGGIGGGSGPSPSGGGSLEDILGGMLGGSSTPSSPGGLESVYSSGEQSFAETIIENERARISTVQPRTDLQMAQDVGTARALDFLKGVLDQ